MDGNCIDFNVPKIFHDVLIQTIFHQYMIFKFNTKKVNLKYFLLLQVKRAVNNL